MFIRTRCIVINLNVKKVEGSSHTPATSNYWSVQHWTDYVIEDLLIDPTS